MTSELTPSTAQIHRLKTERERKHNDERQRLLQIQEDRRIALETTGSVPWNLLSDNEKRIMSRAYEDARNPRPVTYTTLGSHKVTTRQKEIYIECSW